MVEAEKDFCFCTLALGEKYRLLAKRLAGDIEKYSPGTSLVIYTDAPEDFQIQKNVLAFPHQSQGILYCFHDRRLVIDKALSLFRVAIHIDADTAISEPVPEIDWQPGITSGKGKFKNILAHLEGKEKYLGEKIPREREAFTKLASKLSVSLENTFWIQEALYIVARDEGREKEFVKEWGRIGRYLELRGIHRGDGNAIGLAAAKVGWTVNTHGFQDLIKVRKHLDASKDKPPAKKTHTVLDTVKFKLKYHSRLNLARVAALKDFDFYYL